MRQFPHYQDLDIGPYRPGEEEAILDCIRASFEDPLDIETWRHLHFGNPLGQAIIVLARDRRVIVSYSAFVPKRIEVSGQEGLGGHGIWMNTRPEWQRRGLGRTLAAKALEIARQQSFLVIYGFSNDVSRHGVVKYQGRRPVCSLPIMVRPVRPIRGGIALLKAKWLGATTTDSGSYSAPTWTRPTFDERHTALYREMETMPSIAVVRDSSYLTWRYPAVPGSPYLQRDVVREKGVEATVVVRIALQSGLLLVFVMEWLWKRGRLGDGIDLMREVARLARSAGAHGVAALAMPGTTQRRLLYRLGFIGVPDTFIPTRTTLTVRHVDNRTDPPQWFKPSNWYLTFGDGTIL
jgi:GNAT superfamily N-acetyltransferase